MADSDNSTSETLKAISGGYSVCDSQGCTAFTVIKLDGNKVKSFELAGSDISDSIAEGPGTTVKLGSLGTAEVVGSFLGPVSHTLFVDVKFTSPASKTIATNYIASYRGPDKRQVDSTDQYGSTTLQPDSVSYNVFTFKNSALGGRILVKVANNDFDAADEPSSKTLETVSN